MAWLSKSQDHLPLNWWRGQPVYLAGYLAIGAVISMIITSLLLAAHAPLVEALIFTYDGLIGSGRAWTIVSYVFVNPPSVWVVLTSIMLWMWGQEVEKFFGRRVFVKMLVIFILAEPVLLSLIALLGLGTVWPAIGIFQVEFAVFLSFATLYPTARINLILISIEAWILASIYVVINVLQCLAYHNWGGLVLILGITALAYNLVHYERGNWSFSSLFPSLKKRLAKRREPELRVVRRSREDPHPSTTTPSIDEILDKISSKGLDSLTADERHLLEKASKDLGGGRKK